MRSTLNAIRAIGGVTLATTAALLIAAPGAQAQGGDSAENRQKTGERTRFVTKTPEFQARLAEQNVQDNIDLAEIQAEEVPAGADRRDFSGNVCSQRKQECAGDVRYYDWEAETSGYSEQVTFGARSGATLSGKIWATEEGPAKRPGIVITTGSVQAPEPLYWPFAAVLAKHGYVVMTYDVQGQGRSDTRGEAPDENEGVPAQQPQNFVDGTEDALDFFFSTPDSQYSPQPSCGTGTDHGPKHDRRVALDLNAAHNPFWEMLDTDRVGIAGHSLGAAGVSYLGQLDDRVDAIVAWDNLATFDSAFSDCASDSDSRPDDVPLNKPAIGMSNDYGLFGETNFGGGPESRNDGYATYVGGGTDSMQINRRGGTHYEYSFIPGETAPLLGLATFRGMDMAAWYTTAWFDRYVKCQGDPDCEAEADGELLTDRWRDDEREGEIDPSGDPNLYSALLTSKFNFTDSGGDEQICDDVRAGCDNLGDDGEPAGYFAIDDAFAGGGGDGNGSGEGDGGENSGGANDGSGSAGGGGSGAPSAGGASREPFAPARCETNLASASSSQGGTDEGETITGTKGDDVLNGFGGRDTIVGLAGADCLTGDDARDTIRGKDGDDVAFGGAGGDFMKGNKGDDHYAGGAGKDRIRLAGGADIAKGGGGNDNLATGDGRDKLRGGAGDDRLFGNEGNDKIRGGAGNDVLFGGGGRDNVLDGGAGKDRCVVSTRAQNRTRNCERVLIGGARG